MKRAIEAVARGEWPETDTVGSVTLDYDARHRRRIRLDCADGGVKGETSFEMFEIGRAASATYEARDCRPRVPSLAARGGAAMTIESQSRIG